MGKSKIAAPGIDPAVTSFLNDFDHPLRNQIAAVRQAILDVGPQIGEGVKWNAPSFRTTEYFATFNLRARDSVQLIFHLGAKVRDIPAEGLAIADPRGLVKWLAKDRCLVTLGNAAGVSANQVALRDLVVEWIRYV